MTFQEVFTKVVLHLRQQGDKSVAGSACRYRSIYGQEMRACAIGCLIPDEKYVPALEGLPVSALPLGDVLPWLPPTHNPDRTGTADVAFLRRLQDIHDLAFVEDWESAFALLAGDYGLTVP